jgi:hypothetical protein
MQLVQLVSGGTKKIIMGQASTKVRHFHCTNRYKNKYKDGPL